MHITEMQGESKDSKRNATELTARLASLFFLRAKQWAARSHQQKVTCKCKCRQAQRSSLFHAHQICMRLAFFDLRLHRLKNILLEALVLFIYLRAFSRSERRIWRFQGFMQSRNASHKQCRRTRLNTVNMRMFIATWRTLQDGCWNHPPARKFAQKAGPKLDLPDGLSFSSAQMARDQNWGRLADPILGPPFA